ncbi:MAG: chemotaxis-specific protein-glutamate methyltransferase CheB [Pseudomonadota bacterium]
MNVCASAARLLKVMVVDDSGFMRLALKKMLQNDPAIRVVAEANNGEDALRLARLHRPDVITMDVEMPGGGGLDATRLIMEHCPTSIIMVSSLTRAAADTTLQALACGAVDYIPKASSFVDLDIVAIEKELHRKIHYWASRRSPLRGAAAPMPAVRPHAAARRPDGAPDLVVVGASTGGPKILPQLFAQVPRLRCPVVIALHMPPLYTQSFAEHLAAASGQRAVEGEDGMPLEPGMLVVAPGGTDSQVIAGERGFRLAVRRDDRYGIHPSVDALFMSAASQARNPVAVVLTGMGEDGLAGGRELYRRRFPLLAQNEQSSLVYGMPRAVAEAGVASEILDIPGIARRLGAWAA